MADESFEDMRTELLNILGVLSRVPITPDTITQPIIDDWYRRERRYREQITAYQDLLSSIQLYINWFEVTRQLTTEQKELFADAVDVHGRRVAAEEGPAWGEPITAERWWRND